MISRRSVLAGAMATLSTPLLARRLTGRPRPGTPSTLTIHLENKTGSDTVYAFVTGQAIDDGNALVLLESDGKTLYYPSSPPSDGTPLAVDCAIPLNASGGAARVVTIPYLAGARLWFSLGSPITFLLNPGPGLVEPSVTNPSDPNIDLQWDFCEFTYNSTQMYADISMVDFVCLPIALSLSVTGGAAQRVRGLPAGGVDKVCTALKAQARADGNPWGDLIVRSGGKNLRALSPTNGMVYDPSLLTGYFDAYVNQVWSMYESATLTVDTQAQWGNVTGQVSGGVLTFDGVGSFSQPASADIFDCDSGPFSPAGMSAEMLAITPRLAAAFNRSTLLIDASQPDGENPADYYASTVTNHYARIVHATTLDGLGYAFPYDDVTPDGGVNQSGLVVSGSPHVLTATVGRIR
ncbi:MAG TPA: glycoside hydrolase family 64 protein [Streptosporangiaceae bacterium]